MSTTSGRSHEGSGLERIDAPDVVNGPIILAEYRSEWPVLYDREAARIRAALAERAILVEHVGSTSVPGLRAKPKIDIVLAVAASGDEHGYVPELEAVGYSLRIREPGWHEHRVLKGPDADVNLHVFPSGCLEIERMLRFRDHLRRDATARELYERTKRELAGRTWAVTQDYADAKSNVVEAILVRAGAPERTDRCASDASYTSALPGPPVGHVR